MNKWSVFLFAVVLAGNISATTVKWDFESADKQWRPWGIKKTKELTSKRFNEIITYSKERPYKGKQCLVLRDSFSTLNPYMSLGKPIAVKIGRPYLFGGFARSKSAIPVKFSVAVAASNKQGKFIKWLRIENVGAGSEWLEFRLMIKHIPENTAFLRPSVFVHKKYTNDKRVTGEVILDNLYFCEVDSASVDLRSGANRSFSGKVNSQGIGGWTDQGNQDMSGINTGMQTLSGIPFYIINPTENSDKACIILSRRDAKFPKKAVVSNINKKADWLYLLNAAAWAKGGAKAGIMKVEYSDGTMHSFELICGKEVGDWWSDKCTAAVASAMRNACPLKSKVYLFITPFKNPFPDKEIKQITFKSGNHSSPIWMVVALTFGKGINLTEAGIATHRDYSKWMDFKLGFEKSNKALVDISNILLHKPAGKYGFVRSKGGRFEFDNGMPARFFGTNIHSTNTLFPSRKQAEAVAKTLGRYGINIVRLHLPENVLLDLTKKGPSRLTDDKNKWDRFDYFVKSLKENGIYILLDSVTGMSSGKSLKSIELPGKEHYGSRRPWPMYEPKLLRYGRQYLIDLLTHVNKYTGKRLADEPALAMVMLINEQSVFFDWGQKDPEHFKKAYSRLFNDFLKRRYPSREKFEKAWSSKNGVSALLKNEDYKKGNIAPVQVRKISSPSNKWNTFMSPPRVHDTIRFLKEIQYKYNEKMKKTLREIGCKVPVASTNIICGVAELSSHMNMDYTSQNKYYDHSSSQGNKGRGCKNIPLVKINPTDPSQILPETAIAAVKLRNIPVSSTESDAMWPHEWRSSYLLSLASTSALQDWNAIFQYGYASGYGYTWDRLAKAETILNPTNEFNDPAIFGTFPAASLLFLRGDVRPAKNLVRVLYNSKDALTTGFIRNAQYPFNFLPFVSRVEAAFDNDPAGADVTLSALTPPKSKALYINMSFGDSDSLRPKHTKRLDAEMKKAGLLADNTGILPGKVVSDTGEIERNWQKGFLKIDTPLTQGFSGFSGGKNMTFKNISINTLLPFSTIIASSIDNKELGQSGRILLTAVSRAENNTDKISYGKGVRDNGLIRGENLMLERGEGGKVVTEVVKGMIILSGKSATLTPLSGNMTVSGNPINFKHKNGKLNIKFGNVNPSIWYLLEVAR